MNGKVPAEHVEHRTSRLRRTTRLMLMLGMLYVLVVPTVPGYAQESTVSEGMPEGFEVSTWAAVDAPTALDWSADGRLYVMTIPGRAMVFTPAEDGSVGIGSVFHQLPDTNLGIGIAADPDDPSRVYLSDNSAGEGRVWAIADTNGDGAGDDRELVVSGLPADGQHFTEELEINPSDRMLYIASGSRTDNGLDCAGPANTIAKVTGTSDPGCPGEENDWSAALLRADRHARGLHPGDQGLEVVADGFRNIYDVTFWPSDPSLAYTAMNGPTDPGADDVVYATNVHDGATPNEPYANVIQDHGFPSCLINPFERRDPVQERLAPTDELDMTLEPQPTPNQEVLDHYGPCEPQQVTWPVARLGRFPSPAGLRFAHGSAFAGTYGNDLFIAQSGSHDTMEPFAGRNIARINFRDDGTIVTSRDGSPSVEHFAPASTPTDVTFGPDGAMYVTDLAGVILRIAWTGEIEPPDDEGDHDQRRCPPRSGQGDERSQHERGHGSQEGCSERSDRPDRAGTNQRVRAAQELPATGAAPGLPGALALSLAAAGTALYRSTKRRKG